MLSEGIATRRGRCAARSCTATRSSGRLRGAARRAARRAHLGRRDPRQRQLRRRARAGRDHDRHARRGLRHRVDGGRHLPARQHLLAHPPRRDRARCGSRTRGGAPPTIPFWLGEGPGAHARALGRGGRAARRSVADAPPTTRTRRRRGSMRETARSTAAGAELAARLRRGGARRARRGADARHGRRRALLRRGGRHAARDPRALRRPHQPRLGHGAAQALLPQLRLRAAGRGHRRRHRCSRSGPQHSFPLETVFEMLHPSGARGAADAGRAAGADVRDPLALERQRARSRCCAGRAASACRRRSSACAPRICSPRSSRPSSPARTTTAAAPIELPDHPLVRETMRDCLTEAMDVDGPARVLDAHARAARSRRVARETPEPSRVRARDPERQPLRLPRRRAARGAPHARGHACAAGCPPRSPSDIGALDPEAIAAVVDEALARRARSPTSCTTCCSTWARCPRPTTSDRRPDRTWPGYLEALIAAGRAARLRHGDRVLWVAAERRSLAAAVWPDARFEPDVAEPPARRAPAWTDRESALVEIVRARLGLVGPTTAPALAARPGRRPPATSTRRSPRSRPRAACCAAASRRARSPATGSPEMVRPAPARAHPPPDARRAAPRRSSRCHPRRLLRFLFAWQHVRAGQPAARARRPAARDRAAAGLRGRGGRVGARDPARARRAATSPAGSTSSASPARSRGAGSACTRARATRADGSPRPRRSPCCCGATSAGCSTRGRSRARWPPRRRASPRAPRSTCWPISSAPAPPSSRTSRRGVRRLRIEVEDALCELVTAGLVTGDGFAGLRACSTPRSGARPRPGAPALPPRPSPRHRALVPARPTRRAVRRRPGRGARPPVRPPLRRGLPRPPAARAGRPGLARSAARLPAARDARRAPRRAHRGRVRRRAVRGARGARGAPRHPPRGAHRARSSRCRPATRSTWSGS